MEINKRVLANVTDPEKELTHVLQLKRKLSVLHHPNFANDTTDSLLISLKRLAQLCFQRLHI